MQLGILEQYQEPCNLNELNANCFVTNIQPVLKKTARHHRVRIQHTCFIQNIVIEPVG